MQMEENAKRLLESLSGWKSKWKNSRQVRTLGTHLKNAQQSYSESDKLFERAQNTLETMLGAGVPELPFENPQGTLPLPREASAKKALDFSFPSFSARLRPHPIFATLFLCDTINFVDNSVRNERACFPERIRKGPAFAFKSAVSAFASAKQPKVARLESTTYEMRIL